VSARIRLKDVAEKAGVSVWTVSNALNDSGRVSPATRERVCRAAQELEYVPNLLALALRQSARNQPLKAADGARIPRWDDGAVHGELLTNCDYLPTLMEFVGGPEPRGIDGRSFLGFLDGTDYTPREDVFLEMTWHDKYNPMRAIRTNRHKYIRSFGDRPLVYLPLDVWDGPAGQEMREEYYGERRPAEQLYDLERDPLEMEDVAGDPAYAEVLEELRGRVDEWMRETQDRLLEGDWPPTQAQAEREKRGHAN